MLALAAAGYGPLVPAGRKMLPAIPVVVSASSPFALTLPGSSFAPLAPRLTFSPLTTSFPISTTTPLAFVARWTVRPAEAAG